MAPVRIGNKPFGRCESCNHYERTCTCKLCNVAVVRLCCAGVHEGVTECVCTSCFVSVPRAWYKCSHIVRKRASVDIYQNKKVSAISLTMRVREQNEHIDATIALLFDLEHSFDHINTLEHLQ